MAADGESEENLITKSDTWTQKEPEVLEKLWQTH